MLKKEMNSLTNSNKYSYIIFLSVLIVLTTLMIACYTTSDHINWGHDFLFHFRRFKALMEAIENESFPIYIDHSAINNYGYGTKWFYPDLILLPFAYIANVTSIAFAYKSMWFIMTILCGIFSYKSIHVICKNNTAALIGSLLYTFSLYRLQDVFERAAFGEAISFTFVPIVFWGLYEIIKGDYKNWYIISIGFSLLIFSHNISSAITFITIIIILFVHYKLLTKNKQRIKYLVIAGLCSVILSAYFLFPFFEQIYSTRFYFNDPAAGTLAQHNRSSITEIINALISITPHVDITRLVPSIGILLILPFFLRPFLHKKTDTLKYLDIGVIISITYIILTLDFVPWSLYPIKLLNFMQFPWRFFEFCSYLFSIAGAYYIVCVIKNKTILKYLTITICLFIGFQIIITANNYNKVYKSVLISEIPSPNFDNNFLFMNLEYLPEKTSSLSLIQEKGDNISYQKEKTTISNFERSNNGLNFNINVNESDIVELPLIYYKGYNASINDKTVIIRKSKNGFIEMPISESGFVDIKFSGTTIQKYSLYITIIAYLLLSIYIVINRKKIKNYA